MREGGASHVRMYANDRQNLVQVTPGMRLLGPMVLCL